MHFFGGGCYTKPVMTLHCDEVLELDRRNYSRTRLRIESTFFIDGNKLGLRDFTGVIEDISEGGIRFIVDEAHRKDAVDTIKKGTTIKFQAYDEYMLYNQMRDEVFSGEVEVIRIEEFEDGTHFGCKIIKLTDALEAYINNKKISEYIRNGFRI